MNESCGHHDYGKIRQNTLRIFSNILFIVTKSPKNIYFCVLWFAIWHLAGVGKSVVGIRKKMIVRV